LVEVLSADVSVVVPPVLLSESFDPFLLQPKIMAAVITITNSNAIPFFIEILLLIEKIYTPIVLAAKTNCVFYSSVSARLTKKD
jgi:hypothetical protein